MGDLSFLDQEPPPGYVAGLGRGATGFVTSAETGPSAFLSNFGFEAETEDDGLFSVRNTKENEEADKIYDQIEARVQSRHKRKSPEKITEGTSLEPDAVKNQLKLGLNDVSLLQWLDLPEAGDLTRKNKRQRLLDQQLQRVYATPDVLIAQANAKTFDAAIGPEHSVADGNDNDGDDKKDVVTNFATDPEKERRILASLRKVEPKNAQLWISSARYEENSKQFKRAKQFIREGCSLVPDDELVWLESLRLHRNEGARACRAIVNEALAYNNSSEKLWLAALDLENSTDFYSRKRVMLKALEALPRSPVFWGKLVGSIVDSEETDKEEKVRILTNATNLCPQEWHFWERLLSLSDYLASKNVLNIARKTTPQEVKVWVAALELEESESENVLVDKLQKMLRKGKAELALKGTDMDKIDWFQLAISSDKRKKISTASVLIIEELSTLQKSLSTDAILEKIESLETQSADVTAITYDHLTQMLPKEFDCWKKYIQFARKFKPEKLLYIYKQALAASANEQLYLDYAGDTNSIMGKPEDVQGILEGASKHYPKSECIWLARVDFEIQSKRYQNAESISKEAIAEIGEYSPRIWYKYIHFLRFAVEKLALDITQEKVIKEADLALALHPDCLKLYLQKAQILHKSLKLNEGRAVVVEAMKKFPQSVLLWREIAKYDRLLFGAPKARSLLDRATLKIPKLPELWVDKINLEAAEKDMVVARQIVNKALKTFPSCAPIWVIHLRLIPKASHRKVAYIDALKETNNSPEILLAIGVFLWTDGKHEKAKVWFDRALDADKTNGDAWAWLYQYQLRHGSLEERHSVLQEAKQKFSTIKRGSSWTKIRKDPANMVLSVEDLLLLVGEDLLSEES